MANLIKTLVAFLVVAVVAGAGVAFLTKKSDGGVMVSGSSGPAFYFPYISWGLGNGVRQHVTQKGFNAATTTVCAIQSPAATSTLLHGGVSFTVSSTTASTVYLAKATTAFATTTSLGQASLAAGAKGTILASTSPTVLLDPSQVFAPNTYFVVGMTGGAGTFSPSGTCQATFEEFVIY